MTTETLRPAADRLVRKPDGTPLDAEGEPIEIDAFWQRRIDDQDVTIKGATRRERK